MLHGRETYTQQESNTLKKILLDIPGVKLASDPERHPKGGYRVNVEFDSDDDNLPFAFVDCLIAAGYNAVI